MHQSCRLSVQSKYRLFSSAGWILVRPSRTAADAAAAMVSTLTHHCSDRRGSTTVSHREQWPTEWTYGRFSATIRPSARSAATIAGRASNRSIPSNGPCAVIVARPSMIVRFGRPWRWPISKSFGSWAGVTLTAPVPNFGSTCVVGDDRDAAAGQRQLDLGADEVPVALVVRVDGDRGVTEHRLGARGRDDDRVASPSP